MWGTEGSGNGSLQMLLIAGESNPVETARLDLNFAHAMSKVALRRHSSPFVDERRPTV